MSKNSKIMKIIDYYRLESPLSVGTLRKNHNRDLNDTTTGTSVTPQLGQKVRNGKTVLTRVLGKGDVTEMTVLTKVGIFTKKWIFTKSGIFTKKWDFHQKRCISHKRVYFPQTGVSQGVSTNGCIPGGVSTNGVYFRVFPQTGVFPARLGITTAWLGITTARVKKHPFLANNRIKWSKTLLSGKITE